MKTASRPQRTIARPAEVRGISFLSGRDVRVEFRPAAPDAGITIVRSDLDGQPAVAAHVRHAVPRQRRTTLQAGPAIVEMVEHVMAALAGLRVDNCVVAIDGPETPGCDGSSLAFAEALIAAEVVEQPGTAREVLVIDAPVTVVEGDAVLAAYPGPGDDRLVLSYQLDYGADSPIPRQSAFVDVTPDSFRRELASCRTFLLDSEADALRAAGIGARTTERDLLIFGPAGVVGNELRFVDEPARHKALDLLGDLALAGVDLAGHVVAHKSGHAQNTALAAKLLEARDRARPPAKPATATGPATAARPASTVPAPAHPPGPPLPTPVVPLEINEILQALPHRYPFLLVDRVIEFELGRRVVAIKNVTYNEPFFQGHWPGRPIMPGVLIVEAMAQAAGVLIAHGSKAHRYALLVSIDGVKFRRPVVPGDQLRLEVEGVRSTGRATQVRAVAKVGDRVAAEGKIRFVAVDADRPAGAG